MNVRRSYLPGALRQFSLPYLLSLTRGLFDFLVNGHALEDGVVLFEFQTLRRVLAVLRGDIT